MGDSKEGEAPKKEKRSEFVKSFERVHESPLTFAPLLNIDGVNIDGLKELFPMGLQYELFADSADLGQSGGQRNEMNLSLNLNLNGSGTANDETVGEKERKTVGYRHKWYGAEIGDTYTVVGYWDGRRFGKGGGLNLVSRQSYGEMIDGYEGGIWWMRSLCVAGLLIGGGVSIYEVGLLSKLS